MTPIRRVIPIILRPVGWQGAPFEKIQALPTGGKPMTDWPNQDNAFLDIVRGIRKAINDLTIKDIPANQERLWNIPYARNPLFTGRENVLTRLYDALKTSKTAAISGLGGIGKTQTAVEYAFRYRNDYDTILWVKAESLESINLFLWIPVRNTQDQHEHIPLQQTIQGFCKAMGSITTTTSLSRSWLKRSSRPACRAHARVAASPVRALPPLRTASPGRAPGALPPRPCR